MGAFADRLHDLASALSDFRDAGGNAEDVAQAIADLLITPCDPPQENTDEDRPHVPPIER